MMTANELAEILHVSPRTLQQWRYRQQGPGYVKVSHRTVLYDREEVERWLATRTTTRH